MEYRQLGNTGFKTSIIGLGGEYLEGKDQKTVVDVVHAAMDAGVNILDIFMSEPNVRSNIGVALKGRRDKMLIQGQICSVWENGQYKRTRDFEQSKLFLEDLFTRLDTDYMDIGMIHYCDGMDDLEELKRSGIIEYCLKLKEQGRFRRLGIGSHNSTVAMELVNMGIFDMLMFSINPAMDFVYNHYTIQGFIDKMGTVKDPASEQTRLDVDQDRAKLYRLCEEKGVGITVMKTYAGGKLLAKESSPFGKALTPVQCIHYALSRPAVSSVLIGAANVKELNDALLYLEADEAQKDYSTIYEGLTDFKGKSCLYCGHCLPCPANINIAATTKLLDTANQSGLTDELRSEYKALAAKASSCLQCGACESRCPFGIGIRENMKAAAAMFE